MRLLLIGILILGTGTTLAQNVLTVKNKTHPEEKISVVCLDESCLDLVVSHIVDNTIKQKNVINMDKIYEDAAKNIGLKFGCSDKESDLDEVRPGVVKFGLTKTFTSGAKQRWNEGYEVESALQYSVLGTAGVALDVLSTPFFVPFEIINLVLVCVNSDKTVNEKWNIKRSREFLRLLEKESLLMKQRKFLKLKYHLMNL